MDGDDDIAAFLPRPPLPAPARREAAIAEALRRFDGGEERPARAAEDRRTAKQAAWWSRPARPYAGALAGALLVALIALPVAWKSFDRYPAEGGGERRAGVEATPSAPAMADSDAPAADAAPAGPLDRAGPPAAAGEVARPSPAAAREAGEVPDGVSEGPAADFAAKERSEIVVTGSRIRQPNMNSASPVSVVGEEANNVTGTRLKGRGDWNACTIEDPERSLAACRKRVDAAAKGASGKAAAQVAGGLSQAWEGDWEAAIASFDRAIELAPRSSAAYLNRGLAWRRLGDLDRALADLDRAVRYSPRSARFYYQRSLVLRQRGELRRARADESRAADLDPRYAILIGGGR